MKDGRLKFAPILNILGIISSRPCDAVNVVASEPVCNAPWTAHRAAFTLQRHDRRDGAPEILFAFRHPLIAELGHR